MDAKRNSINFLLFSLITCILSLPTQADGPHVQWEKTFGGSNSDLGNSVQQTTDGGYIIAGFTNSFGEPNGDVYLIKTDPNGNLLWQKTFGGSNWDRGNSVQQTSDGGYIIAGWTDSFGAGNEDVYLIKTDSDGNSLWQKTFGGSGWDDGYSVHQTSDGGFIVAGTIGSFGAGGWVYDVYLIKTDSAGNSLWQKTLGGSNGEGYSVQETTDGGFIIAGYTYYLDTGEDYDVYLIKTDSFGELLWQKTFGGSGGDFGNSVQQTSDGGFIIAGFTDSFGAGKADVYLIKTDSAGNSLWQKTFGGSNDDWGLSVQQTSDGGYIIAGETESFGSGSYDVYLIKTDSAGNLLWQKTFGSGGDGLDSVQQTSDGGFIIAGGTDYYSFGTGNCDVYLIKLAGGDLDNDGDVDNNDLELFTSTSNWLNTECNAGNNWCNGADFDRDGDIDFVDFALFAQHWLEGTTP